MNRPSRLSIQIPVEVAGPSTGLAQAVVTELIEHLAVLANSGRLHVIDLTSLPMTGSDKSELERLLGKGEVSITLSTIGDSYIYETAFSGIWWIKHYSADDRLIAELIEVTPIPDIIKSHPDDISKAAIDLAKVIVDESGEAV